MHWLILHINHLPVPLSFYSAIIGFLVARKLRKDRSAGVPSVWPRRLSAFLLLSAAAEFFLVGIYFGHLYT